MEQIHAREGRFKTAAWVVSLVAVLLAAVSAYAIAQTPAPKPEPPVTSQPAASKPAAPTPSQPALSSYEIHAYVSGRRVHEELVDSRFERRSDSVNVGCEQDGETSVSYDVPAQATVLPRAAAWTDIDNVKSHSATISDGGGTIVARGYVRGLDKQLFNCPGGGHATLILSGTIQTRRDVAVDSPPVEIGASELSDGPVTFAAPSDANLRKSMPTGLTSVRLERSRLSRVSNSRCRQTAPDRSSRRYSERSSSSNPGARH